MFNTHSLGRYPTNSTDHHQTVHTDAHHTYAHDRLSKKVCKGLLPWRTDRECPLRLSYPQTLPKWQDHRQAPSPPYFYHKLLACTGKFCSRSEVVAVGWGIDSFELLLLASTLTYFVPCTPNKKRKTKPNQLVLFVGAATQLGEYSREDRLPWNFLVGDFTLGSVYFLHSIPWITIVYLPHPQGPTLAPVPGQGQRLGMLGYIVSRAARGGRRFKSRVGRKKAKVGCLERDSNLHPSNARFDALSATSTKNVWVIHTCNAKLVWVHWKQLLLPIWERVTRNKSFSSRLERLESYTGPSTLWGKVGYNCYYNFQAVDWLQASTLWGTLLENKPVCDCEGDRCDCCITPVSCQTSPIARSRQGLVVWITSLWGNLSQLINRGSV